MSLTNQSLEPLRAIDGYIGAALVDFATGRVLAQDGGDGTNMEVAASGNREVLLAKRRVAQALRLSDVIEDMVINLTSQCHMLRPIEGNEQMFLYLVLDRKRSNLALARYDVREFEQQLKAI